MKSKSGEMSDESRREFVVEAASDVVHSVSEMVQGHRGLVEDEGVVDVLPYSLAQRHLSFWFHLYTLFKGVQCSIYCTRYT